MKTIINKIKENFKIFLAVLVAALVVGFAVGKLTNQHAAQSTNQQVAESAHDHAGESAKQLWTCAMHPQIRMDKPGKCPICGMELIPLSSLGSTEEEADPNAIVMTDAAAKLAEVQTMFVKKGAPEKSLFLQGKVQADERNITELTSRFGGRIEKLFVSFTGQNVKKGEKLAIIYSPELVTAQRELLEAVSYKDSRPALYTAARGKLKLWDLSDKQISDIETLGKPQLYFDVLSPIAGTVMMRHVALGDYVKEGTALFQVIDLSHVWALFDAYESDLPWLKIGDQAEFTIPSLPGKTYKGKVTFIDPFINPTTRISKVRVELNNPKLEIKPEMFVNGTVQSKIAEGSHDLLIPKSAVLWTGKRSVVYVKMPNHKNPTFIYREIALGPEAGNFYIVSGGLMEGEEIAVNGVFKIDAAAQLQGLPSMMNPDGGDSGAGRMPGMDMGGGKKAMKMEQGKSGNAKMESMKTDPAFSDQLTCVYKAYLPLKDAFIASDAGEVSRTAKEVAKALEGVKMELLKGDAHMEWMKQLKTLNGIIQAISQQKNIDQQRQEFSNFNLAFYQSIKTFGLKDATAYYQYCPMANNDQGAYWLSDSKEIRNPYLGEAMLTCGETKETLQ